MSSGVVSNNDDASAPPFDLLDVTPLIAIKSAAYTDEPFRATLQDELTKRHIDVTFKGEGLYVIVIKDNHTNVAHLTERYPDAAVVLLDCPGISYAELGNAHVIARMTLRLRKGDAENLARVVALRIKDNKWG